MVCQYTIHNRTNRVMEVECAVKASGAFMLAGNSQVCSSIRLVAKMDFNRKKVVPPSPMLMISVILKFTPPPGSPGFPVSFSPLEFQRFLLYPLEFCIIVTHSHP